MSLDIVEKSGAWYSFDGDRIGQGRQNVKRFLAENTDIRDKIADQVLRQTGLRKDPKKDDEKTEAPTEAEKK